MLRLFSLISSAHFRHFIFFFTLFFFSLLRHAITLATPLADAAFLYAAAIDIAAAAAPQLADAAAIIFFFRCSCHAFHTLMMPLRFSLPLFFSRYLRRHFADYVSLR